MAQALKTHTDNEFELFAYLGKDLPGALIAIAIEPNAIPDYALDHTAKTSAIKTAVQDKKNHFSLAGIQMKFSMREKDGRYQIAEPGALGDWIIKTPSTTHKHLPLNEFIAMSLAELAGVGIPHIRLVEMNKLEQLPAINLPNEDYAFAIRRFDREDGKRIHMEQFEYWAGKADIPWRAIRPHLLDTMEKARSLWPDALKDLPMDDEHKAGLTDHWQNLQSDFRI